MTNDEEFLAERRKVDDREFLINSLDPEKAPRLAPAHLAVRVLLADGRWHAWIEVLAAGVRGGDLAVKTVDNSLRRAVSAGLIERTGEYVAGRGRKRSVDTRKLRLIDWPGLRAPSPQPGPRPTSNW